MLCLLMTINIKDFILNQWFALTLIALTSIVYFFSPGNDQAF